MICRRECRIYGGGLATLLEQPSAGFCRVEGRAGEGCPRDVAGWHRLGAAVEEQFRTLGGRAASPPEPWDITLACELRH